MILPLYVFFHCLIPIPIQHVEELSVQAYYTLHHKVLYCTIFLFLKTTDTVGSCATRSYDFRFSWVQIGRKTDFM